MWQVDGSSLTAVIDCVGDLWQVDGSSLTAVIDCVGDLWQVDGILMQGTPVSSTKKLTATI
jgi:hypothetical protein